MQDISLTLVLSGAALGVAIVALLVSLEGLRARIAGRGEAPVSSIRRRGRPLRLLLVVAAVVIAGVWLSFRPMYRATAVVRISPVIEPVVFKSERNGPLPFYQEYVGTEVSVIYSPTVLERVLDRAEVRQTEWFQQASRGGQTPVAAMLDGLQRSLNVSPRAGTELIDVSISTGKPRDSKTIVDIVVAEYRRLKEEMDKMSDTQLAETLTAEQATLQLEIDGLIKTRFNISSRLGTDATEQHRSKMTQQLDDMEAELRKLQRELELAEWRQKKTASPSPQSAPSDISTAEEQHREGLRLRMELLKKDMDVQQRKVKEAGDIAMEIANYDEHIRQKRELYEAVRSRRDVLDMEGKAPARVRVAAYATEPAEPCNDRRGSQTGIVLGVAFLLAAVLVAWPQRA